MTQNSATSFTATFPSVQCGQRVRYYISAVLSNGGGVATTDPSTAPGAFYEVPVQTGQTTIVVESFEGAATGWTVAQDATVTFGGWTTGVPVGTTNGAAQASPSADATPGAGTRCFMTGLGAAGGVASSQDLDGGPVTLTSPVYDLSAVTSATMSAAVWYYCDDTTTTPSQADLLRIEVSNGGPWVLMESISANLQWATKSYNLASFVTLNSTVQIRVIATDNPNNSVTEAGFDEFQISAAECISAPACPADFDNDGVVGGADIAALLNAWGSAKRDLDGDGNTGGSDLAILLNSWGSCN
jgi:hypothetical protein